MARKHNGRHTRSKSHYPARLGRRGQSPATVRMLPLDDLRRIQGARLARTGSPWPGRGGENGD